LSNDISKITRAAIIVGTGFENAFGGKFKKAKVDTPYGEVELSFAAIASQRVVVLPRHGVEHSVPPHLVNYRANIWALKEVGVRDIISTAATGSLRADRVPGDVIILDDFIDFRGVITTFFDTDLGQVQHTDFTVPFSARLREALSVSTDTLSKETQVPTVYSDGVYLCVAGPRYETAAEVRLFRMWGADVVGMTVAPEAILARELAISYTAVAVVTNMATGLSPTPLSHSEVTDRMQSVRKFLISLIEATIHTISRDYCDN
jgi:5'-methylthioadenosine phosphorylase